jgi:hypothetical protein|nr:PcfJ domain-containing protein [Neorhizobium tomejilense]
MRLRPDIASYIWKLSDNITVTGLLEVSLGRVLENAGRDGRPVMHLVNAEQATHIADWLAGAVISGEAWLSRTDEDGRPRKLMKFSDVAGILKEADKAMAKLAQKNRSITLAPGEEELYAELEDGYYVVRLLTPKALDRESGTMQHCIGGGGYDHKVGTEHYDYLSLRNRFGKPHATMELDLRPARGPKMIQIYGKQNDAPDTKYALMLRSMFRERGIRLGQVGDIVFDTNWDAHPVAAMPENMHVWGSMDIRNIGDLVLPAKLTVEQDFTLDGCHNVVMPKHMRVGGDMFVLLSTISERSEELAVGRELSLVRVKTPPTGIAEYLRAYIIRGDKVRTWTEVADIDFTMFASMHNCGVHDAQLVEARERTREAMKAERLDPADIQTASVSCPLLP